MKLRKSLITCVTALTMCDTFTACGSTESVSTDGSTSMEKVIGILSESFENDTGISVSYNPTGSSSGIKAVLEGTCDIGLSSRELKDDEISQGLDATVLAYDGIAIIVNSENKISDLSLEQIEKIYTGEIKSWAELGGDDNEIVCIGREAGSGTRDGFETITHTEEKCKLSQELTSTGDVITTVSQNPNAIGYASYASVKDTVKVLSVNGVSPSEVSIKDKSYVIQRPFIIVTKNGTSLSENAQKFYDYITSSDASEVILQAGVIPAK